mmetsp:Transcript_14791/g.36924  ORF Transcript_14791/g.36924 Transcript_14791/m.36924 type:complete len:219 (-) Transcript_14791:1259-1915(-)
MAGRELAAAAARSLATQLGQQAARGRRLGRRRSHLARLLLLGRLHHGCQARGEVAEGGARARRLRPRACHQVRQRGRAACGDTRAQPLLHHAHCGLQRCHVAVRHLARQQLPQHHRKRKHVGLLVVWLVLNDLGRHPAVCARLRCHVPRVLNDARHAKVGDLDNAVVIHEQVGGLEVAVDDLALVQVVHAARHFHRDLEDLRQPQRPLPPDVVVHAAP